MLQPVISAIERGETPEKRAIAGLKAQLVGMDRSNMSLKSSGAKLLLIGLALRKGAFVDGAGMPLGRSTTIRWPPVIEIVKKFTYNESR